MINIQKELLNLINQKEFCELEKYYKNRTIMDILDVSRNENKHSNFIAWLFTNDAEHGLGDYALRKLLETIGFVETKRLKDNNTKLFDLLNIKDIISGNYNLSDIYVEREMTIDGGRRLDIYIEFAIQYKSEKRKEFIIIENKINSSENKAQTEHYYNWAEKRKNNNGFHDFICLYLLPQTKQEYRDYYINNKILCNSPGFIQLSYQYLVDGIIEPCTLKVESDNYKLFIENYIRCLSQPRITSVYSDNGQEIKSNDKGSAEITIMAVGRKEKDLVRIIWHRNKKVFMNIITTLCNIKGQLKDEDRDLLKAFYFNRKVMTPIMFVLAYVLDNNEAKTLDGEATTEEFKYSERLNALLKNKVSYNFNCNRYVKGDKKGNSFGWLGRNLIAEYKKENPSKDIEEFIRMIRKEKRRFYSPWLDEIIIRKKEWDQNPPKRPDHFFVEEKGVIHWDKDEDVYIARYWTKEDVLELSDLLKLKEKIEIIYN